MSMMFTVYGVAIMLLCLVCVYNLVNNVRCYGQFKAFNENVRDWSRELDSSMRAALDRQVMAVLAEMDERLNNSENKDEEDESDETL